MTQMTPAEGDPDHGASAASVLGRSEAAADAAGRDPAASAPPRTPRAPAQSAAAAAPPGGRQCGGSAGEHEGDAILLYYKYAPLAGREAEVKAWYEARCGVLRQRGRVRVATDGVNVTVRRGGLRTAGSAGRGQGRGKGAGWRGHGSLQRARQDTQVQQLT